MVQHTPGPWIKQYVATQDEKGGTKRYNILAGSDQSILVTRLKGWDDEDEANARLIAKAPEMYEWLQLFEADKCPNAIELARYRTSARALMRAIEEG